MAHHMRKSVQTVTYSKHVTFMGVKFDETNTVFAVVTMRNIAGNLEIRVLTLKFAFSAREITLKNGLCVHF